MTEQTRPSGKKAPPPTGHVTRRARRPKTVFTDLRSQRVPPGRHGLITYPEETILPTTRIDIVFHRDANAFDAIDPRKVGLRAPHQERRPPPLPIVAAVGPRPRGLGRVPVLTRDFSSADAGMYFERLAEPLRPLDALIKEARDTVATLGPKR